MSVHFSNSHAMPSCDVIWSNDHVYNFGGTYILQQTIKYFSNTISCLISIANTDSAKCSVNKKSHIKICLHVSGCQAHKKKFYTRYKSVSQTIQLQHTLQTFITVTVHLHNMVPQYSLPWKHLVRYVVNCLGVMCLNNYQSLSIMLSIMCDSE